MINIQTQGFIALTSVLILSAVFLSITLSVTSRSIITSGSSIAFHERDIARQLAYACIEYARMELQRTLDYKGGETVLLGERSCEILEIEGVGDTNRLLEVQITVGAHTYRLKDSIEKVSPEMIITSTERVVQF